MPIDADISPLKEREEEEAEWTDMNIRKARGGEPPRFKCQYLEMLPMNGRHRARFLRRRDESYECM